MKYNVELRGKDGKLYRDNKGRLVTSNSISFDSSVKNETEIQQTCEDIALIYEAITKEGTDITIEVMDFNNISNTWMVLYSYYRIEYRFIKH